MKRGCLILPLIVLVLTANAPAQLPASPTDAPADDPLLGVPPLPKGDVSLVGGVVTGVDRVHNRVTVQPFGTKNKMKLVFDERSHIYRNGVETTQLGIRKGDRVYVDSMLVDGRVFARNIRVVGAPGAADARGQILSYDPTTGRMTLREELTSQPVTLRVDSNTTVRRQNGAGGANDLLPGSLVQVQFSPTAGSRGVAREVSILASPGTTFTFAGQLTHLDLRSGILAVNNQSDSKTYEIYFNADDPRLADAKQNMMVGSNVSIAAIFDGSRYSAKQIQIVQAPRE